GPPGEEDQSLRAGPAADRADRGDRQPVAQGAVRRHRQRAAAALSASPRTDPGQPGKVLMGQDLPALQARFGARYRYWLLALLMTGTMAMVLASTSINVALPAI